LHDLTLYQGDHDQWRTAFAGEVEPEVTQPAVTAAPPATTQPAGDGLRIKLSEVSGNPGRARNFGYQGSTGLFVEEVHPGPGNPAEGKLKPSDIIIDVNGNPAKSAAEFLSVYHGPTLKMKVFRAGNTIDVTIALPAPPTTAAVVTVAKPTTRPATTTAVATAKTFQMAVAPSTQPTELAESWKPIMTSAGVDPADANVMTRIIARYAFDPHRLTAVYRMDDAEFDRLLPLEVVPQPAKITRFALVIVVNADPAAGTIVDDMIRQLGDEDWNKRDAAYRSLAAMGPAATAKLTAAKSDKDLEISWRVEKLLALTQAK
jgi:hypothetical protein